MRTFTKQEVMARALTVLGGVGLMVCGAGAQWGTPAAAMVLGLWLALPARYTAPDKVIVKD